MVRAFNAASSGSLRLVIAQVESATVDHIVVTSFDLPFTRLALSVRVIGTVVSGFAGVARTLDTDVTSLPAMETDRNRLVR